MIDDTEIQGQGYRLNLPLPRPVCGKRRHYDRSEADAHRAVIEHWDQIRGLTKLGPVVTYWCDTCACYHVGHSSSDH
jgi:hypothetical protein